MQKYFSLFLFSLCFPVISFCQIDTSTKNVLSAEITSKKWYDRFSIRRYAQIRYNRLLETNENLGCEQCDKSWGGDGGFSIRRVRVIFSGQLSKNIYFYVQPDFASSSSSDKLHFAQLRDAYFLI